ncbi:MAG TPA: metallopeptidase TldD-related protein, partial [Candidatus Thermoplasmatota archaeon]|nr:metallopeptidase TldD-related protein [Candidatus Thermoplasmatota archaeon]
LPGRHDEEALLEELGEGVLITQPLLGSFASDKVTADVSVVAPFAFYVHQGKVKHALPPTSVGGNAHRVFRSVRAVGREAKDAVVARAPAIVAGGVTCAT